MVKYYFEVYNIYWNRLEIWEDFLIKWTEIISLKWEELVIKLSKEV